MQIPTPCSAFYIDIVVPFKANQIRQLPIALEKLKLLSVIAIELFDFPIDAWDSSNSHTQHAITSRICAQIHFNIFLIFRQTFIIE